MTNSLEKTENQATEKAQKGGGIVAYLNSVTPMLEKAATKHLTAERLIQIFLVEARRNPDLLQCTRESVLGALTLCTQTGLEPGSALGLVYLIPRKNRHNNYRLELNFQPGYKGYAELVRRSKEVARVNAAPVYKWELERGLFEFHHEPPTIRHDWVPDPDACKDQDIVGAYAVVELLNGRQIQLWFSREQIEKRRAKGGSKGGIWREWYPEMCRKTVLRGLLNGGLVPRCNELGIVMAHDPDDWTQQPRTTRNVRAIQDFAPPPESEPTPQAIDTTAEPVEKQEGVYTHQSKLGDPVPQLQETDWAAEWRQELENHQATEKEVAKALKGAMLKGPPETEHDFNVAINALESVLGA